eukprot:Gb_34403 [translate_table: standard]
MVEEDPTPKDLVLLSISNREWAIDELRTMYSQLIDEEKAILRSCGLGRVCRVMQLRVDTSQIMELVQYWDVVHQSFMIPTFKEMCIMRYDIYHIMGDQHCIALRGQGPSFEMGGRFDWASYILDGLWHQAKRDRWAELLLVGFILDIREFPCSPRQESHRRKGGDQTGEIPPVHQLIAEAPVAPSADISSTNRVVDVASTSGEPTIPMSVVDHRLIDIFHNILLEPILDTPSRVTSERGEFVPTYRVAAMYEELRRRLDTAQGENKTLRDMIRMCPPSNPHSRHRSRSRSASSCKRPSDIEE